ILEPRRAQVARQAVSAPGRAVLEQGEAVHADLRRQLEIVEEGAVGHQPRVSVGVAEADLLAPCAEGELAGLAWHHRPVESMSRLRSPPTTWTSRIGALVRLVSV